MASLFSHAAVALSIGVCFYKPPIPKRVLITGMICSMLPDIDVVGFGFGIRYGDFLGHRGFTHSLFFAAVTASLALMLVFRHDPHSMSRYLLWGYLFVATASHGLLDALTDGGLGVAFFSPFDNGRYFLLWRPIRVSPIGITPFFSARGLAVFENELLWIWLPAALLVVMAWTLRRANSTA